MPVRHSVVLLLLVLCAACSVPTQGDPGELDEESTPIAATSCPLGTLEETCSGTGTVWTGLRRVGRGPFDLSEVAQTFRVSTSGQDATLRLTLRLTRALTATPAPDLVVGIRPVSAGVVSTSAAADIARARLSTSSIPRGRATEFVLTFASTTPATPVPLVSGQDYAFVVSVDAAPLGEALVGVASHQSATYASGQPFQRTSRGTESVPVGNPAFTAVTDGNDLSFALAVDNPTCTDVLKNGAESDVDCGGPVCVPCATGKACVVGSDCVSDVCAGLVCQVPTCSDSTFNQDESDVDCGGATCGKCASSKACRVNGDCVSGVCTGLVCQAPSCIDGVKNGGETGTDCGGSCPRCAFGVACNTGADCATRYCNAGSCAYPTTCAQIDVSDATANDGTYSVYPAPPTAEPTYCLMSQAGGGWTLVQRTVWDWTQSAALLTTYAAFYANRIGNAVVGNAYRMPGRYWPTVSPGKQHLLVMRARKTTGAACNPQHYTVTNGTWSVPPGGSAAISGYSASPYGSSVFNAATAFSATDNGPARTSCVTGASAVPWVYDACCSTCPTYGSGYFTPSPRPMASWLNIADINGVTQSTACGGAAVVTSSPSTGYTGLETMEYYVK